MSNLKEPIVITFTATNLTDNAYELIFPAPMRFYFNENFAGSYGWIYAIPSATARYFVRNETQNQDIGSIDIDTAKQFWFNTVEDARFTVQANDIITVKCPSIPVTTFGTFGVSLVGER